MPHTTALITVSTFRGTPYGCLGLPVYVGLYVCLCRPVTYVCLCTYFACATASIHNEHWDLAISDFCINEHRPRTCSGLALRHRPGGQETHPSIFTSFGRTLWEHRGRTAGHVRVASHTRLQPRGDGRHVLDDSQLGVFSMCSQPTQHDTA